ncbi:hypothetical protein OH77DRAFT_1525526 [Trametes cingulata]|nr:hypothetical protein OH77DRAFT_1525526 [Trametes cingulata]
MSGGSCGRPRTRASACASTGGKPPKAEKEKQAKAAAAARAKDVTPPHKTSQRYEYSARFTHLILTPMSQGQS